MTTEVLAQESRFVFFDRLNRFFVSTHSLLLVIADFGLPASSVVRPIFSSSFVYLLLRRPLLSPVSPPCASFNDFRSSACVCVAFDSLSICLSLSKEWIDFQLIKSIDRHPIGIFVGFEFRPLTFSAFPSRWPHESTTMSTFFVCSSDSNCVQLWCSSSHLLETRHTFASTDLSWFASQRFTCPGGFHADRSSRFKRVLNIVLGLECRWVCWPALSMHL